MTTPTSGFVCTFFTSRHHARATPLFQYGFDGPRNLDHKAGTATQFLRTRPARMPRGIVKWFNNKKGFGFITGPDAASPDIFVHYSEILAEGYKALEEGDTVEFELAPSERGPKALKVVKI